MLKFCLVCFVVRIGQSWSKLSVWSVKESAFLAQASLAHLGEISRDAYPIAIRASCSGEEDGVWATQTLAQASEVRLNEIVRELRVLSATSRPGEGFVGFERT